MNFKLVKITLAFILLSPFFSISQRGKDNNYTVTAINTILNTYTSLTANATSGSTSITVSNNALAGVPFTGNLAPGDLIMIMQMQGASMDIDLTNTTFTRPAAYVWDNNWTQSNLKVVEWGKVLNYNNAGKYEQVEVLSVSGTNTITINCPLLNSYTSSGHVQVIRVPRFNNLTVNAGASIIPTAWNGVSGGVIALEVNGNLIMNATGKISATGKGFRGGMTTSTITSPAIQQGNPGSCTPHTNGQGNGGTQIGSAIPNEGGRKGEGIGGYESEYAAQYSNYATGSPANGGGGGGYQNAGGGGGANVGIGNYTGKGVPSSTYAAGYWNIELAGFAGSVSSGGGRGGYSLSGFDRDALTVGPNNTSWCGTPTTTDARKENGGLGGHPLAYDATRLFMGGGGGAGDQDNNQGGSGGTGGGIIHLTCYGTISGTGTFEADGAAGLNSNPNNETVVPFSSNKKGNDGAGGGGAGGALFIKNNSAVPASLTLNSKGGVGGNHNLSLGSFASSEASGPGGGGAGGYVQYSSGTPVVSVAGGANGTTNSSQLTEFIANGATNGGTGITNMINTAFNLTANNVTICSGNTATLTAVVTGILPGTIYWYTQQFGGSSIASGTSYTTPVLTTTTTYYVGVCPGTFRIPVVVTVNPNPVISGVAVLTNPSCSSPGSITGLSVSGGLPSYIYNWNGTITGSINYTNIPAGTYNLTVTDQNGCFDTDGPHTLVGTAGPIIDVTGQVVQDQNCNGTLGSITGITATGNGLTYSWSNGGGNALNATNLVAGTYTLTVTDNNLCVATTAAIVVGSITGPVISTSGIVITQATCGNANGSITGITSSGSGLSYTWNAVPSPSINISGQNGGNYTLVVTDGNGCTASSGPHVIGATASPTISAASIVITPESCNQANGSITGLTINGGAPAYILSWTNTAQTTIDISSLTAGSYSLTVTDQNGCIVTSGPHVVATNGGPSINQTNIVVTPENCNGTLGSISGITATGTGLTYSWTNSGGNALNASNLTVGTYTLTVTDNNSCFVTSTPINVGSITGPVINTGSMIITGSTCGNPNGSITGITSSGTGLSYTWNAVASPTINITGQNSGNFTLVVTDDNGCTASSGPHVIGSSPSPTVTAASVVIIPENCNQANGSISGLTINGGTPAYSYAWTNTAQTTLNINNLTAGSYTLTVTDQNGCVVNSGPHVVAASGGPVLNETNVVVTNVSCSGTLGSITGITASGTGLSYAWSNSGGNALNATNLSAGTYTLTVTDGSGCTASSAPYSVQNPIPLSIDISNAVITNTSCTSNTGSISGIVINGGVNPMFSWSNSAPTLDISNLGVGNYTLTVTDAQGCNVSAMLAITTLNGPVIDTTNMLIVNGTCGLNNGSITGISVNSGTPAYSYQWNSNSTLNTLNLNNANSGINNLVVTDAGGCTAAVAINVNSTPALVINATALTIVQPTCVTLGSISGLTTNGAAPVTYTWTNTSQTTLSIINLSSGNYTLNVSDNNGCTASYGPVVLNTPISPIASFTINPSEPNVNENVDFTNTSQGGTIVGSTWTILGQQTNSTNTQATFPAEGTYSIQLDVINAAGCTNSTIQTITIFGVLVIPNVITVNGDGVNDLFEIQYLKPNSELLILNRWGNIVFETSNYKNDWKGNDKSGNELIEGVYTYVLKTLDGKTEHGFVHLFR